jgi:glycosyltransferase involved in cell wall biosynthesis
MRMPLAFSVAHPMRVAVVTKIFPSSLEPLSAPFNRRQIGELARFCDVQLFVAIPAFPLARTLTVPGRAARLASLPERERVCGLDVTYVRQWYVPRIGLTVAVPLYLASLLPHRERLRTADIVLATWAYPDACAALLLSRLVRKPCVVKVHGSDVNVVLQRPVARTIGSRLLPEAAAAVAVSRPLADELVRLGVAPGAVHVVGNGVDMTLFRPRDRAATRRALGVEETARVILFVGRLEPQKGVRELLDAFDRVRSRIPGALLVLIGDGVSQDTVRARAARWGDRAARILGPRPQVEVAEWMGACDVLTLPSWAEGTPNVVLEALASGRPVVATSVGGIPDALGNPNSGIVVPPRDAHGLADALCRALGRTWDEAVLRACGPRSWTASAKELHEVLVRMLERRQECGRSPGARTLERSEKRTVGAETPTKPRLLL